MLGYCAPFLFLIAIPTLYYLAGPVAPLATIGVLVIALVGAEWILPLFRRERKDADPELTGAGSSRALPLLYIPLQLAVITWAVRVAARDALTVPAELSMILSVGVIAGVFGMLAAHEMAHSPSRIHRFVAFAMLMGTSNPQFRIAHIYGHHRFAGMRRDAATARRGESFYAFLIRTLWQQWRESFTFEGRRCARRGLGAAHNRVLRDAICLVLLVGALAFFSGRSAVFFISQSAVAIIVLELFNYIAHYGLVRETRPDGSRLPLGDEHSWNSSNAVANLLIFNMGRHSDHHRRPTATYQCLVPVRGAPELPAGYAGSILLALVPPLWRRVMDRRALDVRSESATRIALAT
jgi:alkane 1-monooxygenase